MKKKLIAAMLISGVLALAGNAVYAESEEVHSKTASAVSEDAEPDVSGEADEGPLSSLKWSDYAISIDGTVLKFPMLSSDFEALGFEAEDDMSTTLQPMQYSWFYFKKGDKRLSATIANFANNTLPADECVVCGVTIDDYYWPADEGEILLPQGIIRGVSTIEDVEAAYGEPSDIYEGDTYTKLTYETDIYEDLEMEFDLETGTLGEIDICKIAEPENFDAGEVSEEVPVLVSSYRKPESLSDKLGTYEIRVQDAVYDVPVPVSVLVADGWEISADKSDEFIPAKSSAWVTLQKGGKNFRSLARNFEDNAVTIDNGWITSIEVGLQSLDVDAELAGGVTIGMKAEDFEKLLEDAGLEYELNDEDDSFHYYNFAKEDWDQYIQVITYHNGSTYPEDAGLTISVDNSEIPGETEGGEAVESAAEEKG